MTWYAGRENEATGYGRKTEYGGQDGRHVRRVRPDRLDSFNPT